MPLAGGRFDGLAADVWSEDLVVTTADVVATYVDGPAEGEAGDHPQRPRRRCRLVHLDAPRPVARSPRSSTAPTPTRGWCPSAPCPTRSRSCAAGRPTARSEYTVVLNHGTEDVVVPGAGQVLVGDEVDGEVFVRAGGVAVARADVAAGSVITEV